jgi:hypothetical protein
MVHGFMLISRRGALSPYDNPISLWDMEQLLEAADRAGVDLDLTRIRTVEKPGAMGKWMSAAASLRQALSSNDGWFVHASESAELAALLPHVVEGSRDPVFIEQMAKFFEKAARYGGFFVF